MKRTVFASTWFVAVVLSGGAYGHEPKVAGDWKSTVEQKAAKIRPTRDEMRWLEIPWVADAEQANRLAKAEKRPIFIFTVDGDPLDRC